MVDSKKENTHSREAIMNDVTHIIGELLSEWEMQFEEQIGPESHLGADLAFSSLDFVRLISDIQQLYVHKLIPFQELFISDNDQILQDIQVSNLVEFLYKQLNHH